MTECRLRGQPTSGIAQVQTSKLVPKDTAVRRALLASASFYLVVWWLGPSLIHSSPPLDVVEGWVWGQAWQAGYYKHPPLSAWLTAGATTVFGRNLWAVFLLGPLSILLACFAIWALSRQWLNERASFVVLCIATSQLYWSLFVPEFNHNVMQIPLWAAAFTVFVYCLEEATLVRLLALGVVLGLCGLAKYSAVLLFMLLFAIWVADARVRERLTLRDVLVVVGVAILAMGPNLIWQWSNGFSAFAYVADRSGPALGLAGRLRAALSFAGAQLVALLPSLAAMVLIWRRQPAQSSAAFGCERSVLMASVWAPMLACVFAILLTGHAFKSMWGAMLFTTAAPLAVLIRPRGSESLFSRKAWLCWASLQVFLLISYSVMVYYGPLALGKMARAAFPSASLALQLNYQWRRATGGAPLRFVVGDTWTAGTVAFALPSAPDVLIDGDPRKSPWVDAKNLEHCGALLVWPANRPTPAWVSVLAADQPVTAVQSKVETVGGVDLPVTVMSTIIQPTTGCNTR